MNKFKKQNSLDKRKEESTRIMEKYPNRLPIIVQKDKNSKNLPDIDKSKFLAPHDSSLGQFMYIIRKRINLNENETFFLFINDNVLVNTSEHMQDIYEKSKDEDGFLYITYCSENVFGN